MSISKKRYRELKYICLAYPEKVRQIEEFSYINGVGIGQCSGTKKVDNLEKKVVKLIELKKQVEAIEQTCIEVFGGDDYQKAMKNIAYGKSFHSLKLYMSEKTFHRRKGLFFERLDEKI